LGEVAEGAVTNVPLAPCEIECMIRMMKVTKDTSKAEKPKQNPKPRKASGKRMSFKEAKKHVFITYRDVLEKLAK
jgi:hypothetical protein